MDTEINQVTFDSPDAEALGADGAFWALYDEAFPAEEREPRGVILKSVGMGTGVAARARSPSGTVGLVTTHLLRQPPGVFLVYIATHPQLRGRGLGAELFQYAWAVSVAHGEAKGWRPTTYAWEVDDPATGETSEEVRRRQRRIGFFRRLGGEVLPGPYLQPPVNGAEPVRMRLMARTEPGTTMPPLADLVRAIYFEKYGVVNGISKDILDDLFEGSAKMEEQ
jgi:GNAT superfamily N-acetyltransferase